MDTLDKVQEAHTDWTMSIDSVDIVHCRLSGQYSMDIVHCLPGECPWTPWTLSMDSVESVDNVH